MVAEGERRPARNDAVYSEVFLAEPIELFPLDVEWHVFHVRR